MLGIIGIFFIISGFDYINNNKLGLGDKFKEGMISMDNSLLALYRQNVISKDTAIIYSSNTELMEKKIARL